MYSTTGGDYQCEATPETSNRRLKLKNDLLGAFCRQKLTETSQIVFVWL